jgi:DNA polymerase-3 subunit epsilon
VSSLDFVAIDFETATPDRGSACAVGLVQIRGGEITGSWYSLCQPPTGLDVDPKNQRIHGISSGDLVGAPTFAAVAGDIWTRVGLDVVAAHNAPFDRGVWEASWQMSGFAAPRFEWLDTAKLARSVLGSGSVKLPDAAAALGFGFEGSHHHAGDDALMCARVLVGLAGRLGVSGVDELRSSGAAGASKSSGSDPRGHAARNWYATRAKDKPKDVDWSLVRFGDWLRGHVFVFTGVLNALATPDAETLVARFGAEVGQSVTKKTTVLVVGEWDGPPTSKRRRAEELIASGQQIHMLDEAGFLASVGATADELALLAKGG